MIVRIGPVWYLGRNVLGRDVLRLVDPNVIHLAHPRRANWALWLTRLEQASLIALAIVLPLFESPKTIALFGVILGSVGRRIAAGESLRPNSLIEWATICLGASAVASGVVAAATAPAGFDLSRLDGVRHVAMHAVLFLALLRGGYSTALRLSVLAAFAAASAIAGSSVIVTAFMGGAADHMASVGNANTSSLYLLIGYGAALALTALCLRSGRPALALAGVATAGLQVAALVLLGSRTAFAVLIATTALVLWRAIGARAVAFGVPVVGAFLVLAAAANPTLMEKFDQIELGSLDELVGIRADLWRLSMLVFEEHPIMGVGPRNLDTVDYEARGFDFSADPDFDRPDHAHNLILVVATETGVVGLVAWAAFFAVVAAALLSRQPERQDADQTTFRTAAIAAWMTVILGGMFESSFRAEVAVAAFLVWAVALAPLDPAAPPRQPHAQPAV